MKLTLTITREDGTVQTEEIEDAPFNGYPVIITTVMDKDGRVHVDSSSPLEVDDHNDTLRQIAGPIVDFVQKHP